MKLLLGEWSVLIQGCDIECTSYIYIYIYMNTYISISSALPAFLLAAFNNVIIYLLNDDEKKLEPQKTYLVYFLLKE